MIWGQIHETSASLEKKSENDPLRTLDSLNTLRRHLAVRIEALSYGLILYTPELNAETALVNFLKP